MCSIPLYIDHFDGRCLREHRKGNGRPLKWGGKSLLDLDYADDLSILDESVSKMNELLEVLRFQGARIDLKINFKKTKSLKKTRIR